MNGRGPASAAVGAACEARATYEQLSMSSSGSSGPRRSDPAGTKCRGPPPLGNARLRRLELGSSLPRARVRSRIDHLHWVWRHTDSLARVRTRLMSEEPSEREKIHSGLPHRFATARLRRVSHHAGSRATSNPSPALERTTEWIEQATRAIDAPGWAIGFSRDRAYDSRSGPITGPRTR